ncbi:MAG: thermosome subunit [Candidatus Helarchaeota archaeon]|nr:thermosome subunit [Candidatus Helarchaeota archaeon]
MRLVKKPPLILKEGSKRTEGEDALRVNITAAKVIGETVKSTLGPKGMDKMLVDRLGGIVITNDGATILEEIDVRHPAAKIMVEIARTQDSEVGDGTTTAVLLASELLTQAETLLGFKIHPNTIINGYKKALAKSQELLQTLSLSVSLTNLKILKSIAESAINCKLLKDKEEYFANIAVQSILKIQEIREDTSYADIEKIQIVKHQGNSLSDTLMVEGIILEKEIEHPDMIKTVDNAKIALLNVPLEIEKTKFDTEIRIANPLDIKSYLDEEEEILRAMVKKIRDVGANVVITQKGMTLLIEHLLAKNKILAIKRVKKKEMMKIQRAVGGKVVSSVNDLTPEFLGDAGHVEEKLIGTKKMVFIEKCQNPRSVSILIRGSIEHLLHEIERTLIDAMSVIADIVRNNKYITGGGSIEVELAKKLREFAIIIGGREQLAIEAFAGTLETIPKVLAANGGYDPIDVIVELRAKHSIEKNKYYGIDVFTGKIVDMNDLGVLEPLLVKLQALKSATEAASMILKIDDVVAAKLIAPERRAGAPGVGGGQLPPNLGPNPMS